MTILVGDPDAGKAELKRYKGSAEASQADQDAVGGEKTLTIKNNLFQSDADAQSKADSLLARLKDRKEYFDADSEFCPVPIERRDDVLIQERVTPTKSIYHRGYIRGIKLSVTPRNQTLTVILEE